MWVRGLAYIVYFGATVQVRGTTETNLWIEIITESCLTSDSKKSGGEKSSPGQEVSTCCGPDVRVSRALFKACLGHFPRISLCIPSALYGQLGKNAGNLENFTCPVYDSRLSVDRFYVGAAKVHLSYPKPLNYHPPLPLLSPKQWGNSFLRVSPASRSWCWLLSNPGWPWFSGETHTSTQSLPHSELAIMQKCSHVKHTMTLKEKKEVPVNGKHKIMEIA